MAVQRVLALIAGKVQEYVAAVTSAGASSAGQLVALNAAGQVDMTMMPTGVGADTATMTASEQISAGSLVNVYSNSGTANARNADGSVANKEAHGFVIATVAAGAQAVVYLTGLNTAVSGLTPGDAYLSDTAVGGVMTTGAVTPGHTFQQVGVVTAAGALQFNPGPTYVRA